ncbi:hypothetical protein D9758_005407 [Tetrapyrgos nigripes]|uniref:Uncharacterized protein n=1 Tax=Tetrapyrgos nigripes TaxID=182062 RepID=A0A8H5GHM0_9AGAR|nr:hypothetical protein D9758_005407 [Tetrapyrgos nigripes]
MARQAATMPTTSPVVIVDDQAAPTKTNFFTFVGASDHLSWFPTSEVHPFYNATFTMNSGTDLNSQAAIDLKFSGQFAEKSTMAGTGVTVMGLSQCSFGSSCDLFVSLDGGDEKTMKVTDEFDPTRIIVDMQGLSDSDHTLHINATQAFTVVDHALITPGPNTDISKELLHVNHSDAAVQYTGNWLERGSGTTDSTRGTVTRGDQVEFTFAGSNLTALTVFNQTAGGNITVAVSVDGKAPQQITASITLTDEAIDIGGFDDRVELYHPLFNLPFDNDAGNHTVNIQLLSISEFQFFDLRGFTYVPNFQFLNAATSVVPDRVTAAGNGSPNPNSTGSGESSGNGGGNGTSSRKISTGTIAGAVIGAVLGVALLTAAGIMFLRHRRRQERRLRRISILSDQQNSPGSDTPGMQITPFIVPASSTQYPHTQSSPFSPSASSSGNSSERGSSGQPSSNSTPYTKSPIILDAHSPSQGFETSGHSAPETPQHVEAPQHVEPPSQPAPGPIAGNLTQNQLLEMIERLNNRVEELHRPSPISSQRRQESTSSNLQEQMAQCRVVNVIVFDRDASGKHVVNLPLLLSAYVFLKSPPSLRVEDTQDHIEAWGVGFTDDEMKFSLNDLDEFESTNLDCLFEEKALDKPVFGTKRPSDSILMDRDPKRRCLYIGSLFGVIPYPHLLKSSFASHSNAALTLHPWSGALIAIAPYTLPPPVPSQFSRWSWVIPVRGAPPWKQATPGAVLKPPYISDGLPSSSPETPLTPLPVLPIPASELKNQPLLWTHESLQALWSFLCSLREKVSIGPLGLSFSMAKSSHGRPFLNVECIELHSDGHYASSVYTEDESRPASLEAIDYIKVYHNASAAMLLRNVLDSWSYEPKPAESAVENAGSGSSNGNEKEGEEKNNTDDEDTSTRTREEDQEVSNNGSMRCSGAGVMGEQDRTDSSLAAGTDGTQHSKAMQQRRTPKLRPLKGSRLVLLDEHSNAMLIA